MAVNDIRSDLKVSNALLAAIVSNTTTAGAIIDTENFENGLMFTPHLSDWTDGTYTLLLEESDDAAMSGAVAITGDKLIGSLPALTAATVEGAVLESVGVISNLRYVQASLVSTGVTTGADAEVIAIQKGEERPVI